MNRELEQSRLPVTEACPLCGRTGASPRDQMLYRDIWRALAEQWNVTFPDDVVSRNTPSRTSTLAHCDECGLEFFSPISPGDPAFYACLTSRAYYSHRWEFRVVSERLGTEDAVVDFGCGGGAFLRQIRPHVRRAVGVDHNPRVAEDLSTGNIEFVEGDFASFSRAESGSFDVVCAFQILEHMPRAEELMDPARRCLKPGGRLFISVPNRDRYRRQGDEPLDWPPHHVSRWGPPQLVALGDRFGMQVRAIHRQPPEFSFACMYREDKIRDRLRGLVGGHASKQLAKLLRKATFGVRAYERAVNGEVFASAGVYGHTVLAEFQPLPGYEPARSPGSA